MMAISLTPRQQAWLEAHVRRGEFVSVDEAIGRLIDERIAADDDDLAWAKTFVDVALDAVGRGEVVSRAAHRARNAARLAALKPR